MRSPVERFPVAIEAEYAEPAPDARPTSIWTLLALGLMLGAALGFALPVPF